MLVPQIQRITGVWDHALWVHKYAEEYNLPFVHNVRTMLLHTDRTMAEVVELLAIALATPTDLRVMDVGDETEQVLLVFISMVGQFYAAFQMSLSTRVEGAPELRVEDASYAGDSSLQQAIVRNLRRLHQPTAAVDTGLNT